ncbi:hypothetical protein BSZ32_05535 [Rubritalea profundi]|uniref:Uncharacterized protein n=1 Tax=Rubritalea profundi TaxID=1658618 RepID=A0A2S7U0U5_9BACT|nr:hypothetical protein BSZ32_05535 [Rubritalea profundi]
MSRQRINHDRILPAGESRIHTVDKHTFGFVLHSLFRLKGLGDFDNEDFARSGRVIHRHDNHRNPGGRAQWREFQRVAALGEIGFSIGVKPLEFMSMPAEKNRCSVRHST